METYKASGYAKREYCKVEEKYISGHSIRGCKKCRALYMREWRKKNPLTLLQKKKDIARSYANVYLHRGKIKKSNCVVCRSEESEMHHKNYSKPLEVIWLCRKCHLGVTYAKNIRL